MAGIGKRKYIEEQLRDQILADVYSLGSQLPSEPRLAEIYNVSRGTVRQALGSLEREGVIARRSGIGTLVVRKPKQSSIVSFTQQVIEKGKTPLTQVLSKKLISITEAEGRVCEAFVDDCNQPNQEQVYCIDRLRYADDMPVSRQTIYLRAADFGLDLMEYEDFSGSIFKIFDRYHRRAAWADEIIQARRPTKQEIKMLDMQDTASNERLIYERNRITYDDENMPLEVLISVDRGDFFKYYQYRLLAG